MKPGSSAGVGYAPMELQMSPSSPSVELLGQVGMSDVGRVQPAEAAGSETSSTISWESESSNWPSGVCVLLQAAEVGISVKFGTPSPQPWYAAALEGPPTHMASVSSPNADAMTSGATKMLICGGLLEFAACSQAAKLRIVA